MGQAIDGVGKVVCIGGFGAVQGTAYPMAKLIGNEAIIEAKLRQALIAARRRLESGALSSAKKSRESVV